VLKLLIQLLDLLEQHFFHSARLSPAPYLFCNVAVAPVVVGIEKVWGADLGLLLA
jgi:hypothetical protein